MPARCGYGRRTTFSGVPSILEVTDLRTQFTLRTGNVVAVDGVSLSVGEGESLGIVGESGCGKTTLGLSIMRLLPGNGRIASGRVQLGGRDLAALDEREMRAVRGNEVALIPQNPMTSLNPTKTIGWQLVEAVRLHRDVSTGQARRRALDVLTLVEMPRPAERVDQYPHELSGGLRQRVMIAMALACEPKLLIADEPTTALDVTIQAQILDLIDGLRQRLRMAVILITHDMGVIAGRTDNVAVMYAGKVVERTKTETLFTRMRHPYSDALLASVPKTGPNQADRLVSIPGLPPDLSMVHTNCRFHPRCTYATDRCRDEEPPLTPVTGDEAARTGAHEFACFHPVNVEHRPLADQTTPRDEEAAARRAAELDGRPEMLGIEHLVKEFPVMKGGVFRRQVGTVKAVSDVSFSIRTGEAFGLVGESGCGKTTVGSLAVALQKANSGKLRIEGRDVRELNPGDLRRLRADVQLMFQDPYSSLNPRMRVGAIVGEPLRVHERGSSAERRARVYQLLDEVGLSPAAIDRYPHEFSGGQRQRIGLARALALNPKLIVADEPVSALDVSIQAQNPQPDERPSGTAPSDLRPHLPRPGRRSVHGRHNRSHVPGQARRTGAGPRSLRAPGPPLHTRAPGLRARARPRCGSPEVSSSRRPGRVAFGCSPPVRVPFPHPLSPCRRTLCAGGAASGQFWCGPRCCLPLPARDAHQALRIIFGGPVGTRRRRREYGPVAQ